MICSSYLLHVEPLASGMELSRLEPDECSAGFRARPS